MRIKVNIKKGSFIKATNAAEALSAKAATQSVKQTSIKMRDAARSAIAAGGFGPHWQKSMVASMHPKRGDVMNPWAWIHSRINFSDVFEEGKTVVAGKRRQWLWLPLPTVPLYPGTGVIGQPRRQMTPKVYIDNVGPLKSARGRGGKPPILLGLINTTTAGRSWLWSRKAKKRGLGTKAGFQQWVPMFVGVNSATIEKRFNATDAMKRASQGLREIFDGVINEGGGYV